MRLSLHHCQRLQRLTVTTHSFGDRHTPQQVLIDALEQADDMQVVVIVYLDKEDFIHSGWSDGSSLKRIGMLETVKSSILESQDEPDDAA